MAGDSSVYCVLFFSFGPLAIFFVQAVTPQKLLHPMDMYFIADTVIDT